MSSHGAASASIPAKGSTSHHRRKSLEAVVAKLDVKSDTSSPGTSPYLVTSKVKKTSIRPITSKLEKPTNPGIDLPHIHVGPQQLQRQQQVGGTWFQQLPAGVSAVGSCLTKTLGI